MSDLRVVTKKELRRAKRIREVALLLVTGVGVAGMWAVGRVEPIEIEVPTETFVFNECEPCEECAPAETLLLEICEIERESCREALSECDEMYAAVEGCGPVVAICEECEECFDCGRLHCAEVEECEVCVEYATPEVLIIPTPINTEPALAWPDLPSTILVVDDEPKAMHQAAFGFTTDQRLSAGYGYVAKSGVGFEAKAFFDMDPANEAKIRCLEPTFDVFDDYPQPSPGPTNCVPTSITEEEDEWSIGFWLTHTWR